MGLAGIWTTGRKVLLSLAPSEKVGEFFGLYGITMKLSVVGCMTFGLIDGWVGSMKGAFLAQLVQLSLGLALLFCIKGYESGSRKRECELSENWR